MHPQELDCILRTRCSLTLTPVLALSEACLVCQAFAGFYQLLRALLRLQEFTGTVGGPLPLLTFRLEAVPEMGYDPLANPPRGEVIIKGPVVFQGYFKVGLQNAECSLMSCARTARHVHAPVLGHWIWGLCACSSQICSFQMRLSGTPNAHGARAGLLC